MGVPLRTLHVAHATYRAGGTAGVVAGLPTMEALASSSPSFRPMAQSSALSPRDASRHSKGECLDKCICSAAYEQVSASSCLCFLKPVELPALAVLLSLPPRSCPDLCPCRLQRKEPQTSRKSTPGRHKTAVGILPAQLRVHAMATEASVTCKCVVKVQKVFFFSLLIAAGAVFNCTLVLPEEGEVVGYIKKREGGVCRSQWPSLPNYSLVFNDALQCLMHQPQEVLHFLAIYTS
jgi:hypothetical protein